MFVKLTHDHHNLSVIFALLLTLILSEYSNTLEYNIYCTYVAKTEPKQYLTYLEIVPTLNSIPEIRGIMFGMFGSKLAFSIFLGEKHIQVLSVIAILTTNVFLAKILILAISYPKRSKKFRNGIVTCTFYLGCVG